MLNASALDIACSNRNASKEILEILANKDNINHADFLGFTPLHHLCKHSIPTFEKLEALMIKKADVNFQTSSFQNIQFHQTPVPHPIYFLMKNPQIGSEEINRLIIPFLIGGLHSYVFEELYLSEISRKSHLIDNLEYTRMKMKNQDFWNIATHKYFPVQIKQMIIIFLFYLKIWLRNNLLGRIFPKPIRIIIVKYIADSSLIRISNTSEPITR